jgi:branched-chain amino acid transport system permease protein
VAGLQYLINGIVEGSIYALIALGYTMVYGILGMINFAHGEIFMLGAYVGILAIGLFMSWGLVLICAPLAILLAIAFAVLVCSVWGAALERIAYRPLRNAPTLSPLICAIGASFFLWNLVMVCQEKEPKSIPDEARSWLADVRFPEHGPVGITLLEIGILVTSFLMMGGLFFFINYTRLGKAMRATAQDRTMASLVGIPINRVIAATFVIGSGLAAVAGMMFAMYASAMHYYDGYLPGMKAFTAAVLGGIGNVLGAMLGGLTLGIVENLAMWEGGRVYASALILGIIILCVVFFTLRSRMPKARLMRWLAACGIAIGVGTLKVTLEFEVPVFDDFLNHVLGRADYKHVYAFMILMLVLIFRPRGILGERVSERV